MKRICHGAIWTAYWLTLLFCGVCRIFFKLYLIEPETGFYARETALVAAVNLVLGLALLVLILCNALRPVDNDYPVVPEGRKTGLLAVVVGLSIILYTLESLRWPVPAGNPGVELSAVGRAAGAVTGVLAAAGFLTVGVTDLIRREPARGRGSARSLLALAAGLWQMVLLMFKFNHYTTPISISDHLLTVLFMVFACIFLIGHARTLGGYARKDGRNYTIGSGLCASLCGLLVVVPNYVCMAAGGTRLIPAPLLGGWESLYTLSLSLYALAFSVKLYGSIQNV